MTILNHYAIINKLIMFYNQNKRLFASFENIYLFGSLLRNDYSNDVDLLLVYTHYKPDLLCEIELIAEAVESVVNLPVDLTALSVKELNDTGFLNKIKDYRIIK